MTRAKRIEEAARALLWHADNPSLRMGYFALYRDALRSALALPEEESKAGYVLRYQNDTLLDACSEGVSELPLVRPRTSKLVRVRITVEGEESER